MAILYRHDGTQEIYPEPANGTYYELAELKAAIGGGYIEVVHLNDGQLMIVDEDGKRKNMPANNVATAIIRECLAADDLIVGDALVIDIEEIR